MGLRLGEDKQIVSIIETYLILLLEMGLIHRSSAAVGIFYSFIP